MGKTQLQKLEKQREALTRKIAEQKKKIDYRRKYLIGIMIEKAIEDNKLDKNYLLELADIYIKNPSDRELFNIEKSQESIL